MINFLKRLLGIESLSERVRRLERAQYWREKYKHNGEMTKLIMVNRPSRLNTVHIDIPEIEEIPINYIQIKKMRFYGLKVFMAIHMLYTLYYMYNYSICRDNFNICYQILNKNNYTN